MELRPATFEELLARNDATYSAWGDPLTPARYREREVALRDTVWARAAQRTWVLVDGKFIVASCETYRMESDVRGLRGYSEAVASVYVEPALRRRGHASRLLRLLGQRLRTEGAQAAVLWSEVDPALYARAGFAAVPATTRFWPARPGSAGVDRLDATYVSGLLSTAASRPHRFRVHVTPGQVAWHRARADFYARAAGRPADAPAALARGASWALLGPDLRRNALRLLDLGGGAEELAQVIQAACAEALRLGLAEVTVVENAHNAASLPPGFRRPCDEGVPMLAPFATALQASDWRDPKRAMWV